MWVKPVFSGWDKSGTLISKFEEKSWDVDIEKITVSHCHHIACITRLLVVVVRVVEVLFLHLDADLVGDVVGVEVDDGGDEVVAHGDLADALPVARALFVHKSTSLTCNSLLN